MMTREFAVYKGDEIICTGTAKECAAILGVQPKYINWLSTPTAMKRLAKLKDPDRSLTAIKLDLDEE
ncbi:MAG: hypothetical protein ABS938_00090 [Psychrobacillus psychrodurans]